MTKARLDGLYLLLLGTMVFLFLGAIGAKVNPASMVDFKVLYYPARCLIQQCDPYNEAQVERIAQAEGGQSSLDSEMTRHIIDRYIYLPTAFSFTLPFAMLPWGPAHVLWMTATIASLFLASFLIWDIGAHYAPVLSGALIGLLLANSETLMMLGNSAGLAISLCAVAVWCFLRERFVPAGILCIAVSLAFKPQDAGPVWLYFLLAGGIYRRRALQAFFLMAALSLPGVLWVWRVAPHWMPEWHSNLLAFSAHGGASDPALAAMGHRALDMMVSLQTAISFFWDDPHIYNPASYLVCFLPLFVWVVITLRSRFSSKGAWLALAAIAALSMLPTYHRAHDARLLIITVPACAILWAEGGVIGRLALWINVVGFVLIGDIPWIILHVLFGKYDLSTTGTAGRLLTAIWIFPTPLILLVMGMFYLWGYLRLYSGQGRAAAVPYAEPTAKSE
jgi:hypothetical protein